MDNFRMVKYAPVAAGALVVPSAPVLATPAPLGTFLGPARVLEKGIYILQQTSGRGAVHNF
jgi:hypothetical protein